MEIIIRGDKLKITDSMHAYIEEKLGKLEKYLKNSDEIRANVIVKVKNHEQRVEITIPLKTYIVRAEETKDDFYAAVDKALDTLERQIRKNKTRLMSKQGKTNHDFDISVIETEPEKETEDKKIVKRKTVEVKPMDEEEAILQMELLGHQFYMYKDSNTNKTAVVYQRNDGNYGVIESE